MSLLLIDKSAYVGGGADASESDELCLCAVTRLELLCSARSQGDYERLERALSLLRDLRMDAETFAVAITAQRELAALGHHRVAIGDLLIAACAQPHGAEVAHFDRHFETPAQVLAFTPTRARGNG